MSAWHTFYKNRVNDRYREHIRRAYKPFVNAILESVEHLPSACMIELGCGIGSISRELMHARPQDIHVLVDRCEMMLELTSLNLNNINTEYRLLSADMTQCLKQISGRKPDVVHSHGVLEHMTDEQIRATIGHQLAISDTLIHYVPSSKYTSPSFGDERLMTPDEWYKICTPDHILQFNDGYDLILIWRK